MIIEQLQFLTTVASKLPAILQSHCCTHRAEIWSSLRTSRSEITWASILTKQKIWKKRKKKRFNNTHDGVSETNAPSPHRFSFLPEPPNNNTTAPRLVSQIHLLYRYRRRKDAPVSPMTLESGTFLDGNAHHDDNCPGCHGPRSCPFPFSCGYILCRCGLGARAVWLVVLVGVTDDTGK